MKPLIEKIRAGAGDEAYRVRAAIASRSRTMVETMLVAPAGHAPLTRRVMEFLSNQPDARDVMDHLEARLQDEQEHRRYFTIGFKEGGTRSVVPDPDDPTRLDHALVSSMAEGLVRVDEEGDEVQLIASRPDAID